MNKITIKCDEYLQCLENEEIWKNNFLLHYQSLLCLKEIKTKCSNIKLHEAFNKIKSKIKEQEIDFNFQNYLCILPKNHIGKCNKNIHSKLFNNQQIKNRFNYIFQTPGNNDYIYKNRSDRLFPIQISSNNEKIFKNKNIKLKCAIPLKDGSTPLFLASSYFDMLVLITNIYKIEDYINLKIFNQYKEILLKHKQFLLKYYKSFNRNIFKNEYLS